MRRSGGRLCTQSLVESLPCGVRGNSKGYTVSSRSHRILLFPSLCFLIGQSLAACFGFSLTHHHWTRSSAVHTSGMSSNRASCIESEAYCNAAQQPNNIEGVHNHRRRNKLCRMASDEVTRGADAILLASMAASKQQGNSQTNLSPNSTTTDAFHIFMAQETTSRRLFFASALAATCTALAANPARAAAAADGALNSAADTTYLQWQATPVNKRTGVTVYDAEQAGYNVRFVTYLSRFLLNFDPACQKWWYSRASNIPITASAGQVTSQRLSQFAAFSASVEVGLQGYLGPDGPTRLLRSLLKRYCQPLDEVMRTRADLGSPPLSDREAAYEQREIKEARRQLALLFALLEENQPVSELTKLLAAIDNGSIASVEILNPGSGYAPGYGPPQVRFPPPEAGEGYETATGRAVLRPNGKILRVDVVNRGVGYSKVPTVTIAPPAAIRFDGESDFAETAEAKAILFRSGPNKGRVERIQLTIPGAGYGDREIIRIRFSPPDLPIQQGGITATATAVLEYEVGSIQIIRNGTGYAVEKPIQIFVDPPPLTARVNMNDPLVARIVSPNEPLPATTIPSKDMLKRMPDPNDPTSVEARVTREASRGGGGGCVGRACYDTPVSAVAYARAEADVFDTFRTEEDRKRLRSLLLRKSSDDMPQQLMDVDALPPKPRISASSSGANSGPPELLKFGGGPSPSDILLSLLPAGIGLEFDSDVGRYKIAVDMSYQSSTPLWEQDYFQKAFDPDFGPRGRSPIERDKELDLASYLRFVASGAICCSVVHLALTPIDVVKTKLQTDSIKYPGAIQAFQKVLKEEGAASFFTGWEPTFVGFFVWGGVAFSLTEFLKRAATELAGSSASSLVTPIILFASGVAAFVGSFVICPFEAVRIRSVAQPTYGSNILSVFNRLILEEGFGTLFSAVPAFLLKEVPFAMAKFTIFDLTTAYLYEVFPAAREDLQLSLFVSLAGGTMGGIVAAVVSNPADTTISEMKKASTNMGPLAAAQLVLKRGGPPALFRGLPLRLVFYTLMIGLQFLLYDAIRIALGVGADDLKLYLDVLGGALKESGGPA